MSIDADSVEGLGDVVVADINALVARRLREEHLYHFIRSRDELLRLERSDDSETIRLLRRQYLRGLEQTWRAVLQTLRSELPKTLDQLFSKLQPEFQTAGGSPSLSRDNTPVNLPSTSAKTSRPLRTHTPEPMPSQASDASGINSPIARNRERSPAPTPDTTVFMKDEELGTGIGAEPLELDSPNKPSEKRALTPEETITSPKKKPRRTAQTNFKAPGYSGYKPIKKNMFLSEVEKEECIFSHSGYLGFYVLRCNLLKCRKELGQDEGTIFKSHPFNDRLALEHFGEGCHDIDSEPGIFRKFAIRIIDAESERNVDKKDSQMSDGNLSGEDLTPKPTGTQASKDKGKKPERPYNLYSPRTPAAEASTSASASNINETFKESFYRVGDPTDDNSELPVPERKRQPYPE
ncbi:hypothetical protein E0Z10_g10508 [Xylaria hypoxylon]|uniref:Uncharacterized protein n=1 Tax=Xylaria hypoxylon TaxID=37992 RepID=A0A4Z0Y5W4_9PEZI|nr:hypothetical protein E0Z10_g10508 [Xylaria hypoxylon]